MKAAAYLNKGSLLQKKYKWIIITWQREAQALVRASCHEGERGLASPRMHIPGGGPELSSAMPPAELFGYGY